MQTFTLAEIIFIMAATLFIVGITTFVTGVVILVKRVYSKDIRQITEQTTKLAQKGLAQDISGLVGNASTLLIATSEMVKTSSGLGVLLLFMGFFQIVGGVLLMLTLNPR